MEALIAGPWTQFGIAGLFGLFAVLLIRYFLNHLAHETELWQADRKASTEIWAAKMDKLSEAIARLDGTITGMGGKKP